MAVLRVGRLRSGGGDGRGPRVRGPRRGLNQGRRGLGVGDPWGPSLSSATSSCSFWALARGGAPPPPSGRQGMSLGNIVSWVGFEDLILGQHLSL